MTSTTLTISSKTYSSWSLRGWLLCKMAGLEFEERVLSADDPSTRAELLLLSPSFLVPCLEHDGDGLGYAGDRRVSRRNQAEGGPLAEGPRRARALPRDFRRDAFRLRQSALGAADEFKSQASRLQSVGRRPSRTSTA